MNYTAKQKRRADDQMTKATKRFKKDVSKDEGDYGNVPAQYRKAAPGPTYDQELRPGDVIEGEEETMNEQIEILLYAVLSEAVSFNEGHETDHEFYDHNADRPISHPLFRHEDGKHYMYMGTSSKNGHKPMYRHHDGSKVHDKLGSFGTAIHAKNTDHQDSLEKKAGAHHSNFWNFKESTDPNMKCAVCGGRHHPAAKHTARALAPENNIGESTINEEDGFSLLAAKATRQAYKTNKPEDHRAAMNAHLKARGSEFPNVFAVSAFQPNVDRWHYHDKQAKMHKAELKESLVPDGTHKNRKYSADAISKSKAAWAATETAKKNFTPDNHSTAEKKHRIAFTAHTPGGEAAKVHAGQANVHREIAKQMQEARDPFGFGKKDLARLHGIDQSIKKEVADRDKSKIHPLAKSMHPGSVTKKSEGNKMSEGERPSPAEMQKASIFKKPVAGKEVLDEFGLEEGKTKKGPKWVGNSTTIQRTPEDIRRLSKAAVGMPPSGKVIKSKADKKQKYKKPFDLDEDSWENPDKTNGTDEEKKRLKQQKANAARRERHAAMTDLGMKRVKGATSGRTYYENEEEPTHDCPTCGSADHLTFHPYDFGHSRETGYSDSGEGYHCHKCGSKGDIDDAVRRPKPVRETQLDDEPQKFQTANNALVGLKDWELPAAAKAKENDKKKSAAGLWAKIAPRPKSVF